MRGEKNKAVFFFFLLLVAGVNLTSARTVTSGLATTPRKSQESVTLLFSPSREAFKAQHSAQPYLQSREPHSHPWEKVGPGS